MLFKKKKVEKLLAKQRSYTRPFDRAHGSDILNVSYDLCTTLQKKTFLNENIYALFDGCNFRLESCL